jgi:hypothetical protein
VRVGQWERELLVVANEHAGRLDHALAF